MRNHLASVLLASGFVTLLGGVGTPASPAFADPPPPAAATSGTLVVRVTTPGATKGAPPGAVGGASVVARDEAGERGHVVADGKGVARFAALPVGDYSVRVDAERFAGDEKDVSVVAGEEAPLEVSLTPGVPFDGTIVDDESGEPIAGASVSVEAHGAVGGFMSSASRAAYARARSDGKGRFHVTGVPEGQIASVEAVAEGHCAVAFPLRVLGGQVTPSPVVLRLPRGGRVVGVVKGPDGHVVASATVYVMPAASEELRRNPRSWRMSQSGQREQAATATSGADGRYRVDGLPFDVEYVAVADAEGFSRSEEAVGLALSKSKAQASVDLVLRRAALLRVLLVDPEGKPVTAAKVTVGETPRLSERSKDAPDEKNEYRFEGLEPGEWPIKVESPAFRTTWAKAVVEAGKTVETTVRLDPGLSVAGVAVDEDGKPFVGAHVGVKTVGGEEPSPGGWTEIPIFGRTADTDASGRFVVRGLSAKDVAIDAFGFRTAAGAVAEKREEAEDSYGTLGAVRAKPPAADVRLVLVRRCTAVLRLVTPDGKPFEGEASMVMDGEKGKSSGGSGRTITNGILRLIGIGNREGDGEAEWNVWIVIDGYLPVSRDFAVRPRARVDLGTIVLDRGVPVQGRVVDPSGAPVAGARVSGTSGAATDENGTFTLPHEARGKTRVSVVADGFLEATVEVDASPEMAPVEVRLARGALLKGVFVDADGARSQEDLFVWRIGADGKRLDHEEDIVTPQADGSFSTRLAPGRYRLVARAAAPGETPPPLGDFSLAEGETREVVLKLPR